MKTSFKKIALLSGLVFLISGCGNLSDSSLSGDSATINLTIQNPDPNAHGVAKAVSGIEQSKAPSSSTLSTCTLSASGPASVSSTVTVPSGAATIEASLAIPVGNGYTITAECLDGDKTINGVGAGIRGSASNVNIGGSDSIAISALFLNLASRSSGDARYCRIKQDSTTQLQIVCGFNGALTATQKTTAQCNIEVDSGLTATSPTTVDASRSNGFVSGGKGKPYFIMGPGANAPSCFEYNTSGTKILKCTGSWSTDSAGNAVMQGTFGVRQAEGIATGRNARFAAACTIDGTNYAALPSSGVAELKTGGGGDSDVTSLIANSLTCSTSRNGETCSSGLCAGNSICGAISLPSYATASDHAGSGVAGTAAGSATSATFNTPVGICAKPDGTGIFVMDFNGNMVRYIDLTVASTSSLRVVNFCGTGTSGNTTGACTTSKISGPKYCTFSPDGTALFFTQQSNHLVSKIAPLSSASAAQLTTVAGTGAAGFVNATGTSASFSTPRGIAIDADSNLYIADSGNNAIRKTTSAGVVSTFAGGTQGSTDGTGTAAKFDGPFGLTIDSTKTFLYLADANNQAVRKINLVTGVVSTVASGSSNFTTSITDIAINPNDEDKLFALDTHAVKKVVVSTGAVTTFTGSTSSSGSTNGAIGSASFNSLFGIAFSPDGVTMYLGDVGNSKVRQIQ